MSEQGLTDPHIFMAMSGGVDSSVSAALLQEQGYRVTGAFIKAWQPPFLECRSHEDRADAQRVAGQLGIPFTTVDLEEVYERQVVEYMIEEYRRGRTPNPDILCNYWVKFGAFLTEAQSRGADMIATGHYARKTAGSPSPVSDGSRFRLLQGTDIKKDQTYFLWTLGQEQLARTLFPVGEYTKPAVRELARYYDLPVAEKKDSQGVCFLGKLDMKEFLSRYLDAQPGAVLNSAGQVVGQHRGAIFYTLGERRGFEITKLRPDQPPVFVVDKDLSRNTITVAPRPEVERDYGVSSVELEKISWIAGEEPSAGQYQCRFRHQQALRDCKFMPETGEIHFRGPQTAVSSGQSLVLYRGAECLGGGMIQTVSYI